MFYSWMHGAMGPCLKTLGQYTMDTIPTYLHYSKILLSTHFLYPILSFGGVLCRRVYILCGNLPIIIILCLFTAVYYLTMS